MYPFLMIPRTQNPYLDPDLESLPAYSRDPLLPKYSSHNTITTTQPSQIVWPGVDTTYTTTSRGTRANRPSRASLWAKIFLIFVFVAFLVMLALGVWIVPRYGTAFAFSSHLK
ncbi:hypothetical protein BO78DRAFT_385149 [Aspergillus sclerotiicarbonarius CBS 121057]|uniref:Uncharacterized protein n=1 Tax=Aspergillus sclerotiicarbonarius (strain CBS 121057 / IBT 28362) TaxID=1448318 RepID=A0A319EVR9_ASPSB|nr:hypothetical protein BO78DRAFT_385149 [Aspergillus sclerotiicarbonarius CBS 121057]